MIGTLLRIGRTNLSRDRTGLTMVFVLPIAFFSIFALVFGRAGQSGTPRIEVVIADLDRSPNSRRMVEVLKADPQLEARDSLAARGTAGGPYDRARAESAVKNGNVPIAYVIPAGWAATFPDLAHGGKPIDVLVDPSDPVASNVAPGLLQRAAGTLMKRLAADEAAEYLGTRPASAQAEEPAMLVATNVTRVLGDPQRGGRMISFYAAGIAVMFLLFSCSAAGGALLDEQESGTLERVLGTRVGMNGLLFGKWLHILLVGCAQITVMFLWGMFVFHLDLLGHLPGFAVMTVATAAAAAAFGLLLATMSKTRQQLSGLSTLLVLTMSALGGSMFPRFLMSASMQKLGLVTFNAWALDGYLKVFWRELPVAALAPQVGVLLGITLVCGMLARLLARRWETV